MRAPNPKVPGRPEMFANPRRNPKAKNGSVSPMPEHVSQVNGSLVLFINVQHQLLVGFAQYAVNGLLNDLRSGYTKLKTLSSHAFNKDR